jgi:hypothetical protein
MRLRHKIKQRGCTILSKIVVRCVFSGVLKLLEVFESTDSFNIRTPGRFLYIIPKTHFTFLARMFFQKGEYIMGGGTGTFSSCSIQAYSFLLCLLQCSGSGSGRSVFASWIRIKDSIKF